MLNEVFDRIFFLVLACYFVEPLESADIIADTLRRDSGLPEIFRALIANEIRSQVNQVLFKNKAKPLLGGSTNENLYMIKIDVRHKHVRLKDQVWLRAPEHV